VGGGKRQNFETMDRTQRIIRELCAHGCRIYVYKAVFTKKEGSGEEKVRT
jgi:uncharacterized protein YutD